MPGLLAFPCDVSAPVVFQCQVSIVATALSCCHQYQYRITQTSSSTAQGSRPCQGTTGPMIQATVCFTLSS